MSARDFSVMPVVIEGVDDVPFERRVRNRSGTLKAGTVCDVEIGASWDHSVAPPRRVEGCYVACDVTKLEGALVYVRLAEPTEEATPACICDQGWVCEDHPGKPVGHGCGGAGMPCQRPGCPWPRWQP